MKMSFLQTLNLKTKEVIQNFKIEVLQWQNLKNQTINRFSRKNNNSSKA